MSTNSLVAALAAGATTVAICLSIGVSANVSAPVGLLVGGIVAVAFFVNSPAAIPPVPIAAPPAKKSKKAAKKEVIKRPPTPIEEDSSSDASASELSEDDSEESSQSKNAKKKAKKKQKEAEAKAAAAAAAKKAEEEKKKAAKKAAAPAPVAAPSAKKEEPKKAKKAKEEKKAAAAPAPRTPSPPPQPEEEEEEEFQTSKASKKKAKQDAKKAEKKEVDVVPTPAPKKATAAAPAPASPAPVTAAPGPKKSEKKAAAPAPVAEKPAEDDGWETAKAAKPTIAQKQAAKVANAEKKVEEVINTNTSDVYSEFVDIPARAVPAIIGSQGKVLKALQEGTHATIEIPPASARAIDSLTVRVTVSGEPEAVRFAKTCVKSLAEKGFSAVTHPGFVSDDIYVESKQHGFIIGPKGSTLKAIQTKSGTRIQMPERGGNDRVLIVGPKEGVKAAKEAIKQLVADGFSSLTHEGTEKKEIAFPREKIGWLIGPNGQTIKSIQGDTKCKINIPRDNSNVVTIVGPADRIAAAERQILNTLEPRVKKGKKDAEPDAESEEKEADAAEPEGPQGAYDAWTQQEAAPTEEQLWQ